MAPGMLLRCMMGCKNHDRYIRLRVWYFKKIPIDIITPCCLYPENQTPYFQEKRFGREGKFDPALFEKAIASFCSPQNCNHFVEGESPIDEIVVGTWRKCPLKCITCFNHYENYFDEPVLSDEEMDDYLFSLGELIAAVQGRTGQAPIIQIGGSGDIFFSENYRGMLARDLSAYGIPRIHLLTNMQFWTTENIKKICSPVRKSIERISFSVDSADPVLYEKIREGSLWKNLITSYENCTAAFPDAEYIITYTVSTLNFHEYRSAPEILWHLFPKTKAIIMNMARDWLGRPETHALVIPREKQREVAEWAASNPIPGLHIGYMGL